MDCGTHVAPFSGRGRYAKSAYSTLVLHFFHVLRGPNNDIKSEVKCSTPKMMPNVVNMGPLGLHVGVIFDTLGSLFRMLCFSSKMGTLGECDE